MAIKRINEERMKNADFDIFCIVNKRPVHIATMGSHIPSLLNDEQRIIRDVDMVAYMPNSFDVEFNLDLIKKLINDKDNYSYLQLVNQDIQESEFVKLPSFDWFDEKVPLFAKLFAWSFVEIARKGFYSFAHYGDTDSDSYFLVAWPKQINHSIIHKFNERSFSSSCINFDNPREIGIVSFEKLS